MLIFTRIVVVERCRRSGVRMRSRRVTVRPEKWVYGMIDENVAKNIVIAYLIGPEVDGWFSLLPDDEAGIGDAWVVSWWWFGRLPDAEVGLPVAEALVGALVAEGWWWWWCSRSLIWSISFSSPASLVTLMVMNSELSTDEVSSASSSSSANSSFCDDRSNCSPR